MGVRLWVMVRECEYVVVGAGPAGLQLGWLLGRDGRDYVVLERGDGPGMFFRRFPRHRRLISNNKVHTGFGDPELRLRMDWNSLLSDDPELVFTRYSDRYFPPADDLVRYLEDYAGRLGVRVEYGVEVTRVSRDAGSGVFVVEDASGGVWRAGCVVVATGVSRMFVPEIPGIEHAELYADFETDPAGFTDQRVLIIGKGNSGFETADSLIETAAVIHVVGPGSVHFAWRTHYVGHLRAVNNNFLDTYQLKSQNAVLDGRVVEIRKEADGYHVPIAFERVDEVVKEIRYDRVIVCTGFRFDAGIFAEECRPSLVIDGRFPELTPAYESVNVPGLYFAGTLTQSLSSSAIRPVCSRLRSPQPSLNGTQTVRDVHPLFSSTISYSCRSNSARASGGGSPPVRIDGMSCQTITPSRSAQ